MTVTWIRDERKRISWEYERFVQMPPGDIVGMTSIHKQDQHILDFPGYLIKGPAIGYLIFTIQNFMTSAVSTVQKSFLA